jgi:hypothetical protein
MLFDVIGERFKAAGRVLIFDGFLKVYAEVDEEKEKKGEEDKLQLLPPVEVGEQVPKVQEILEEKKTKPPGRFTLGSLVKELERLEIGRPSTYAAITKNITDRGYVWIWLWRIRKPGSVFVKVFTTRWGSPFRLYALRADVRAKGSSSTRAILHKRCGLRVSLARRAGRQLHLRLFRKPRRQPERNRNSVNSKWDKAGFFKQSDVKVIMETGRRP